MTQFVIPNADPIATLTFEDVVTIDISSFTNAGDYISFSLPEFPRTKINIAESYVDFTSNLKGDFGSGPTDSIKFSEASPALPATAGDTEMRVPISLLKTVDKSKLSGVRFRIFATEECTFRCLSIRACDEKWKYAPTDLDTLWHRVHRPPTPNGSTKALRTNVLKNPSSETNQTGWSISASSWTESNLARSSNIEIPIGNGFWAEHLTAKKDATTTQRTLALKLVTDEVITAGLPYSLSAEIYVIDPIASGFQVRIDWSTATTFISSSVVSSAFTSTGAATLEVNNQIAPAGAVKATVFLFGTSSVSGDTVDMWADSWLFEQSTKVGTYFDGSFRGASWTGTAHASTSILNSAFPANEAGAFPAIFRSAETFGITDPEPVNLEVAAVFRAGSFGQAKEGKSNSIAMIFRDYPEDDQTQIEVNSFTMAQLDGLGKQPDFGHALYDARDQEDVDQEVQSELDTSTQFAIERKRDESEHSWIEVRLEWSATAASNQLSILNADEVGYVYTGIPIEASVITELDKGKYALLANVENETCQVSIYKVDQVGNIGTKVYDTGVLRDGTLFKRRKGRFGWQASLLDGDAYIESIKTRGVNYGEVVSKEFQSITPVKGATIFAGSTDDKQLVERFEPTSPYTSIELDTSASSSGRAIKVITTPGQSLQGIATNIFRIDDPGNLDISFDIKFPTSQIPGGGLSAFLIGEYEQIIAMNLTGFKRDTWSHVRVAVPSKKIFQTGSYQFVLMQTLPVANAPWWIENLSVTTSSVKWSARPQGTDAWSDREEKWQETGHTLNSEEGGIVFEKPGNGLQVRAQTFRQDAEIHNYKIVPQYATLGRVTFPKLTTVTYSAPTTVTKSASLAINGGGWFQPKNVLLEDAKYASFEEMGSGSLYIQEFGFTLPPTAILKGMTVKIKRKRAGVLPELGHYVKDSGVMILKNASPVGSNLANAIPWGTEVATITYGGATELWGLSLSPSDVNSPNFGVFVEVSNSIEGGRGEIDYVSLAVTYVISE